jgi:hypothetical protein
MDEFSYLSVLISVILGLAVTQISERLQRSIAVPKPNSHLLAGRRMGRAVAPGLFAKLVVDVRNAG